MKLTNKLFSLSLVILVSVILTGCSASPDYSGYRDNLRDQMHEMINVLNVGHYNEFMSTYVSPAYVKSMGGVNAALLQFGNTRQQALLGALRVAQNLQPLYNEKSGLMTYTSTSLPQPVIFKMESGKWYLTNDWFK